MALAIQILHAELLHPHASRHVATAHVIDGPREHGAAGIRRARNDLRDDRQLRSGTGSSDSSTLVFRFALTSIGVPNVTYRVCEMNSL